MPWRGRDFTRAWWERNARGALLALLIAGAAATSLGGTNATVEPDPADLRLLPPNPTTTTTSSTTTTVPAPPPPEAPPAAVGAVLSRADATRHLARAMAAVVPGRGPLPADVTVFAAQVPPGSDPRELARRFVSHRYASLVAHRSWFRALGVAPPACGLLGGPEAAIEPAFRYELAC